MSRVAARLRALPLAVLAAVAVAAVLVRLRTPPSPRARVETAAAASPAVRPASSGIDAPLAAPRGAPFPDAAVPPGAARMIHGSPSHVHRAAARGPRSAKRVGFHVDVGGPVAAQVTASPDEQTLYVATLAGSVAALARDDGRTRWRVPLGSVSAAGPGTGVHAERVYSTPLVGDDGAIYVGTDAKKLVALSPVGTVTWRLEVDGEVDTGPTFASDGTIVVAAGSEVLSVRRGGDLAWRFAAKGKIFTSPAVTADGLVIVGSQDDHVYAIGAGGALAWATDLGADVDGAPAIADDGAIYVGTDKGEIVKLDGKGSVAWRAPVGGFVRGALSIARNGDVLAGTYGPVPRVVRVAPDGTLRGARAIAGTGAREFGIHGGPIEDADGTLFFGAQDDAVYAIGADGALRWRFETGADVDAPLTILADGSLVVGSEDGTVTLLLP